MEIRIKVHPQKTLLGISLKRSWKRLKMAQGRGSAGQIVVLGLVFALLWLQNADAAVYTVGGPGGWTFHVDSWPKGKSFRAGDLLKFNYDSSIHNVVIVNKAGYANCRAPAGSVVLRSGNDQVRLVRGLNNFICSVPGHCESGMKISVNAL